MGGNFDFLRSVDKDLYEIINDAERLYRGEFFEQCIGQTRRFGEHLCRKVLGKNRTNEITFDEMLATLKDKIGNSEEEKELINDLYFLKKQGNDAVHSATVKHSGMNALECLNHAFEASINYAVNYKKANEDILKLIFDTELLVTENKSKKTLSEKYTQAKEKTIKKNTAKKTKSAAKPKTAKKQSTSIKSVPQKAGVPTFWIIFGILVITAFVTVIYILL